MDGEGALSVFEYSRSSNNPQDRTHLYEFLESASGRELYIDLKIARGLDSYSL